MNTMKRLTKAYQRAQIEYFDANSKYIFLSDSHRGDDSVSDEFTRNQHIFLHVLDHYYEQGFTYVEVGDGDELWEFKNFDHIRLAHSDVFKAIKKFHDDKRLIMLYGNHNIYLKYPKFVEDHLYYCYDEYRQIKTEMFPDIKPIEALVLRSSLTQQEIFIVHGHQGDLLNDQLWPISMVLVRYFWRFMHLVGFSNPSSPARNFYKRHKVEKQYRKWIRKHQRMLICGHTHRAKFPKPDELPYFNTGCCINTRGIPVIEIENHEIQMVDWRVAADEQGFVKIKRTLMRGPEPLETYAVRESYNISRKSAK